MRARGSGRLQSRKSDISLISSSVNAVRSDGDSHLIAANALPSILTPSTLTSLSPTPCRSNASNTSPTQPPSASLPLSAILPNVAVLTTPLANPCIPPSVHSADSSVRTRSLAAASSGTTRWR